MRFSSPLFFLGAGILAIACSSSSDGAAPTTTLDGGTGCKTGAECASGLCNADNGQCLPATAGDGKKDGSETDVDCGGDAASPCADLKACAAATDCKSDVCTGSVCQIPTTSDGVKNGTETGTDCGGAGNPKCADTQGCTTRDDCTSDVCTGNACAAATDADGVQNGTETDIDCGGPTAKRCATGGKCTGVDDCASKSCDTANTKTCLAPTFDDAIQNGTETDVDCGGTVGKECKAGLSCLLGSDCASNGCGYDKKCAVRASCTPQHGGATCKTGDGNATESCCTQVSVAANKYTGAAFTVDKYVATAGRMRAFLTAVNGDVRGYMTANAPAWWKADWTPWLPASFNGHVNNDYGQPVISTTVQGWNTSEYTRSGMTVTPTAGVAAHAINVTHINIASAWAQVTAGILYDQGSQGCYLGTDGTGHPTYNVPQADAAAIYGDNYARWISQDALDERPINCTNMLVLAALCAFDGGMPMNEKQYAYIYDDDGSLNTAGTALSPSRSTYPWGTPPAFTCTANATTGITTCAPPATGYDKNTKPQAGGYASLKNKSTNITEWTMVGPGTSGFNSMACPECSDEWVNWQFNYQDTAWDPYKAGVAAAEQDRRARDQSYFISVPGQFPKGASRAFDGQRVQDIAGLMFESVLPSSGSYTNAPTYISFGTDETTDDLAVNVPSMSMYGGSFEGHAVGAGATYKTTQKYGKLTTRCAYPVK